MEIDDLFDDTHSEHVQPTSQQKTDQVSQFPEVFQARQGYESVGDRRKRDLRAQIIEEMDKLLDNYTFLGSKGTCSIMKDILASQKFVCKFPGTLPMNIEISKDDKILQSLAKDYFASKDKEYSKLVRTQGRKISEKILIGGTFKGSKLQVNGAKSRIEAAKSLGRVHKSGDERRRLLSIVALNSHNQYSSHIFIVQRELLLRLEFTVFFSEEVAPHRMALNLPGRLLALKQSMNFTNLLNKTTSQGHHHAEVSLSMAKKLLFAIGSMMSRMSFSKTSSNSQVV